MAKKKAKLQRGEGWVTPRGTRWQANWRDGERQRGKTFDSEEEALEFLRDIARDKRKGDYVPPSALTVDKLIADYMERQRGDWSGNTYSTYARRVESFITPTLGPLLVAELDTPRLQHWSDTLRRNGVAPSTIGGARAILSGALRQAVRLNIIRGNPLMGISTPTVRKARHETWSFAEMRSALAVVQDEPMWHALYRLMLTAGLRPGEARALRWTDIDLGRRTVHVDVSMTRDDEGRIAVGDHTKTHAGRKVLVPASTVDALRTWQTAQKRVQLAAKQWDAQGYVFTGKKGQPLSQAVWQRRHELLWPAAKVKRITLHELRHTFATVSLAMGTPVKVVSEMLGHASVQMTMDLYMHTTVDMQVAAADAMESRLA